MNKAAFLYSSTALLMWSTLALLGHKLNKIPPFLLLSLTLFVGGSLSLPFYKKWCFHKLTLLVVTGGIFGYHFFLFSSFRLIPTVIANLLNYLWPLLIVLLTPIILKNHKLGKTHIMGVLMGFMGTALLFIPLYTHPTHSIGSILLGVLLAILAAFIWACYSVITKKLPPFSSATVGLGCLISAVISFFLHQLTEDFPSLSQQEIIYTILLGIGPMGLSFYAWDKAMKVGDPRVIGTLSYLTPLLSTGFLVMGTEQVLTMFHIGSLILIVSGAMVSNLKLSIKP